MEVFKIAIIGIITAVSALIVREHRPDVAILISISGGIVILLSIVEYLGETISFLRSIADAGKIDGGIIKVLVKIVGIGYITDFSANIAEESGSRGLGEKIVLGGKILILLASMPIVKSVFNMISTLLL